MSETQASKFLSLVLRHRPEEVGLELDSRGWVEVSELLDALSTAGMSITASELEDLVASNDKQRFAFNVDRTKIRANQGHSVAVNLGLKPANPPAVLYDGTPRRIAATILKDGLQKMNRQHVHLHTDLSMAINVGGRRGRPVVLCVDARAMAKSGFRFYETANGVWLTDEVPPEFLDEIEGDLGR